MRNVLNQVKFIPLEHSGNAVVHHTEDQEQVVKASEDDQQVIEGVLHILSRQDVDRKTVPNQAECSNSRLNVNNTNNMVIIPI